MNLPQTLHGQLFLLAHDRRRHRFDGDNRWRFGLAPRAAMLTDLYLTGHLQDKDGRPYQVGITSPGDPVLRAALDEIGDNEQQKNWARVVAHGSQREAPWTCALPAGSGRLAMGAAAPGGRHHPLCPSPAAW